MRAPFSWFGGKMALAKYIVPLIPEHNCYVEVFGGSGAILFAKEPSPLEIYNDIDSGLVNFYRVLRDPEKSKELQLLLELSPYSREEYYHNKAHLDDTDVSDVEQARRWFSVIKQAFNASMKAGWKRSTKAGRTGSNASTRPWINTIDMFPEFHARIRDVQIENSDFRAVFRNYDSPNTFFYLDPPYVLETRTAGKQYRFELVNQDHIDFIDHVLSLKGKCMISGYDHPLYLRLMGEGWYRQEFKVKALTDHSVYESRQARLEGTTYTKADRTEVLWLNYAPVEEAAPVMLKAA